MPESNIRQAIAACREESGGLLHNRQRMAMVKETEGDGYCDISGRVGDLEILGNSYPSLPDAVEAS